MRGRSVARWLRSLHAQLFLWAVLPVTFVIIALAFTGVYAHQRSMRDFVASRDLTLARLTARMVGDALAWGIVGTDGAGLDVWLSTAAGHHDGVIAVMDQDGRVLASSGSQPMGARVRNDPSVVKALGQAEGVVIVSDGGTESVLVAAAAVGGTEWAVLIAEPVADLVDPILRLSSLTPAVAVGAGALSLLILTFGWRTIVRPLQELARRAGQVSWGDFTAIAEPIGGVLEVQDLHDALAQMVGRIQSYEAGVRGYLSAVTEGQEVERARLARELHDGPVQELIALSQQAEMALRMLERGEDEQAQSLLRELRQAELQTVAELRRIIGALRPAYLEDLGFVPALEMLVRQTADQTAARVRLEKEGTVHRCDPEVELAAYRIVQEALNNALQHAQAQRITIYVGCDANRTTLSVIDDGVGFTLPSRPDELTRRGHFGLLGMQERATRLGGSLKVQTAPGQGTRVTVHLPSHLTPS